MLCRERVSFPLAVSMGHLSLLRGRTLASVTRDDFVASDVPATEELTDDFFDSEKNLLTPDPLESAPSIALFGDLVLDRASTASIITIAFAAGDMDDCANCGSRRYFEESVLANEEDEVPLYPRLFGGGCPNCLPAWSTDGVLFPSTFTRTHP